MAGRAACDGPTASAAAARASHASTDGRSDHAIHTAPNGGSEGQHHLVQGVDIRRNVGLGHHRDVIVPTGEGAGPPPSRHREPIEHHRREVDRGVAPLSRLADRHQAGTEGVALLVGMAQQDPTLAQGRQQGVGGRLVEGATAGDLGQREPITGVRGQQLEYRHGPVGAWRGPCHPITRRPGASRNRPAGRLVGSPTGGRARGAGLALVTAAPALASPKVLSVRAIYFLMRPCALG